MLLCIFLLVVLYPIAPSALLFLAETGQMPAETREVFLQVASRDPRIEPYTRVFLVREVEHFAYLANKDAVGLFETEQGNQALLEARQAISPSEARFLLQVARRSYYAALTIVNNR